MIDFTALTIDEIIDAWQRFLPSVDFNSRAGFLAAMAIANRAPENMTSAPGVADFIASVSANLRARQSASLREAANRPAPAPPSVQVKRQEPATPKRTAAEIRGFIAKVSGTIEVDPKALGKLGRLVKELKATERREAENV